MDQERRDRTPAQLVAERVERWQGMRVVRRARKRRLAIAARKGGAGKTTTAIELGSIFARWGLRVRLHDCDPQMGCASFWLPPQTQTHTVREVFLGETIGRDEITGEPEVRAVSLAEATAPTSVPGLFLVPSTTTLAEVELKRPPGSDTLLREQMDVEDEWDLEIIDCSPGLGTVTVSALAAATDVVFTMKGSGLDFAALAEFAKQLKRIQERLNPGLDVMAAVLCDIDTQTSLSRRVAEALAKTFPKAHQASIPHSVRSSEASFAHQPLIQFEPRNPVSQKYWELGEAMIPLLDLEVV